MSSRVQFTLHGRDDEPQNIELLRSRERDNPSFGAVKLRLPVDIDVVSRNSRLVVQRVSEGGSADYARIRQGDIIRAVSVPATEDNEGSDASWWARLGRSPVPDTEKGMAILDGKSV